MTTVVPALDGVAPAAGTAAASARHAATGNALVRLAGVSKTYAAHSVPALATLDLEIRQGEFFSLLGPSGSGKTTTLRLIAGFEIPDTGRVVLDGVDVTWEPPFRRDVRTVFQSYALFPHMTIEQNVAYPLRMAGVPRAEIGGRVRRALELVEMVGFEARLPHQLSGGQRQRVALARALVGNPKVLLLDEPLGALDLQLRQQMQLVLRELQREVGITFIYVTHDQGEALSMSDRLAVMDHGRLQQIGTPEAVYYRPANRFVAGFIGRSNLLGCDIVRQGEAAMARTSAGLLALDGPHDPGPATLAIRYEALTLASDAPPAPGESRIRGTVDSQMFLGDVRELVVRAGENDLALRVPALQPLPAPGAAVELSVLNRDLVVLRD